MWVYRLATAALFLTLIYSTGLHIAWGPEATIRATYFNSPPDRRLQKHFPDYASLHQKPIDVLGDDAWKLGGFTKDQAEYLIQSTSLGEGRPPYVYRALPTSLAGMLADLTGWSLPRAFMVLNVVCILSAALIFSSYLRTNYGFGETTSLLGAVLLITMVAVTRTVSYPMLEPASTLAVAVVFWTVAKRQTVGFVVVTAAAVATKEVLVVTGLVWFAHHAQRKSSRKLVADLCLATWPIAVFVLIRIYLGGAITTHDGHAILSGDLPAHAERLTSTGGLISLMHRSALAFGVLWLGLVAVRKHRFLARHAVMIPPILLAAFLLSHQITRVLGILYPVVIPGFLLLLARLAPAQSNCCADEHAKAEIS